MQIVAPAKINLFLDIGDRRNDGYHEVDTVIVPVPGLADVVTMEPADRLTVQCEHPAVPEGEGNLCWRAAEAYASAAGPGAADWAIRIAKKIPVAAGLGGGSSDAAAILKGLNREAARPLPEVVLQQLAVELGADVPFFLEGRAARGRGIGEQLSPVPAPPPMGILLANPGFPLSTRWAYEQLDRGGARHRSVEPLLAALNSGGCEAIAGAMWNAFEAPTVNKFPLVAMLLEFCRERGALVSQLCGSGPTCFALFPSSAAVADTADLMHRELDPAIWTWSGWIGAAR